MFLEAAIDSNLNRVAEFSSEMLTSSFETTRCHTEENYILKDLRWNVENAKIILEQIYEVRSKSLFIRANL